MMEKFTLKKVSNFKSDNATTISNKCNLIFLQQIMSLIRNFKNKKSLFSLVKKILQKI